MRFHPMPRYIMRKFALKGLLKKQHCSGKTLLEFGYGAGEVFSMYEKIGIHAYGYDFSEDAYQYASELNKNNKVRLIQDKKKLEKKKFDFVVACEVLEHIKEADQAIEEWMTYLKPGGHLILSVPAHQSRWDESDILVGHVKRYEKWELRQLCSNHSLIVKNIVCYDFPSCFILDKLRTKRAKKRIQEDNRGKNLTEDTKVSGIDRDQNKLFRFLSNPVFLAPLLFFQRIFYRTDFGSAYLMIAQNSRKK